MQISDSRLVLAGEISSAVDLIKHQSSRPGFTRTGFGQLPVTTGEETAVSVTHIGGAAAFVKVGERYGPCASFEAGESDTRIDPGATVILSISAGSNVTFASRSVSHLPAVLAVATGRAHDAEMAAAQTSVLAKAKLLARGRR